MTSQQLEPMFATYADAQAWVAQGAKRAGGLKRFAATPEYHAVYDQIRALYEVERYASAAAAMERMRAAGIEIGDRVSVAVSGLLSGGTTHTGTVVDRRGSPVVKIDGEMDVSRNGRIAAVKSLPWDARWAKAQAAI